MTAAELRSLAPRLCRAYDQLLEGVALARHQARVTGDELLSDDRCLAHRELQLVRAASRGDGRYIGQRQRKLDEIKERRERAVRRARDARRDLERAERAVRDVEVRAA